MRRVAGWCGIVAASTFNAGWIAGDRAQPPAFSPARDDISDLGALTADHPWLYNQLAANVSGLLVAVLGVGLWGAMRRSRVGRAGSAALVVVGAGVFLDGIFRLDCRGIDRGCANDSWHASAHKLESGITVVAALASFVLLPLAFRRLASWRHAWLPTAATIPALLAANIAFSGLGAGAATRAGTAVLFVGFAFLGSRLVSVADTVG